MRCCHSWRPSGWRNPAGTGPRTGSLRHGRGRGSLPAALPRASEDASGSFGLAAVPRCTTPESRPKAALPLWPSEMVRVLLLRTLSRRDGCVKPAPTAAHCSAERHRLAESTTSRPLERGMARSQSTTFNETGAARPGRTCEPDAGKAIIRPSESAPSSMVSERPRRPRVERLDVTTPEKARKTAMRMRGLKPPRGS